LQQGHQASDPSSIRALQYVIAIQLVEKDNDGARLTIHELYARDPDLCFIPLGVLLMDANTADQTWKFVTDVKALDHQPGLAAIHLNSQLAAGTVDPDRENEYRKLYTDHPNDYTIAMSYGYYLLRDCKRHDPAVFAAFESASKVAHAENHKTDEAMAMASEAAARALHGETSVATAMFKAALLLDDKCDLANACQKVLLDN
jgi:hypothetical protein